MRSLLDERVRRGGSHHQKLVRAPAPRRPGRDVAFVGGIDLCHGRHDDAAHRRRPQAIELDPRYGDRPPWHDIQLEVRGPAVGDLAYTFRERWEDPTPLDHRNPVAPRAAQPGHASRADPIRCRRSPPDPPPRRAARGPGAAHVSRRSDRRSPSRPTASAASPAPTSKAFAGRSDSSTSRTSTSGHGTRPTALADALRVGARAAPDRGRPALPRPETAASADRRAASAGSACSSRSARRRRRPRRGLRPREPSRDADLRARQGVRRRRHVDEVGIRQPEPSARGPTTPSCRARCSTRRSTNAPPTRSRRSRRRRARCSARHRAPPVARAPRPGRRRRRRPRRPDDRRRRPARERGRAGAMDPDGRRGARPPGRLRPHRPEPVRGLTALWADALPPHRRRSGWSAPCLTTAPSGSDRGPRRMPEARSGGAAPSPRNSSTASSW